MAKHLAAKSKVSFTKRAKTLIIGRSRNIEDKTIFHKISLIAFFAWVGLGADGLSSSCYGPQEAFLALHTHTYLSLFVALGTVLTIFIISTSYSQIVELFPRGGGGYLVSSRLLSSTLGMISGCALLIDYVLTISVSIASGADAIFSFLPLHLQAYKFSFALLAVLLLTVLNMRGIKESVVILTPIFLTFIATHVFIIFYALFVHLPNFLALAASTSSDIHSTISQIGLFGMLFLIMRAYSMGAGTFTGIEAVSNGIPVLREPKVRTAKHTMRYMAFSLAFVVLGLMLAYLFYGISIQPGKTLNAILFEQATKGWRAGYVFVLVALISEATLLFVAAQTGFLGGPRVLANMAVDRWFPTKFATLSDRLVTQNGVLIMGGLAAIFIFFTRGSVRFLVVLYSINVFITFVLAQLGMVRHWWNYRFKEKLWLRKFIVNGIGLVLCSFILVSMIIFKFHEGGWMTLLITGGLVVLAIFIKRHYYNTAKLLHRLNSLVAAVGSEINGHKELDSLIKPDFSAKTAVLLVSGFNGIGLHTLFGIIKNFSNFYKNYIFVAISVADAGNFRDSDDVIKLQSQTNEELGRYVSFMNKQGFYAESVTTIGVDVAEEIEKITPKILSRFPSSTFFGGQLLFPRDSFATRMLHNHTVFILQKRLYRQGIPLMILPIRV